jgi:hypothetical protein
VKLGADTIPGWVLARDQLDKEVMLALLAFFSALIATQNKEPWRSLRVTRGFPLPVPPATTVDRSKPLLYLDQFDDQGPLESTMQRRLNEFTYAGHDYITLGTINLVVGDWGVQTTPATGGADMCQWVKSALRDVFNPLWLTLPGATRPIHTQFSFAAWNGEARVTLTEATLFGLNFRKIDVTNARLALRPELGDEVYDLRGNFEIEVASAQTVEADDVLA